MVQVVTVNGRPESGKTTFEDFCLEELTEVWGGKTSTVDFIKELAKEMGWDGVKTPETRAFLSDLKDLASRAPWGDVPLMKIRQYCIGRDYELCQYGIADKSTVYIFVDVREPENLKKMKEELGAVSVLVRRPGDWAKSVSNHADMDVFLYDYDFTIENDGTLEDLKNSAKKFIIDLKSYKGKEMWRF